MVVVVRVLFDANLAVATIGRSGGCLGGRGNCVGGLLGGHVGCCSVSGCRVGGRGVRLLRGLLVVELVPVVIVVVLAVGG